MKKNLFLLIFAFFIFNLSINGQSYNSSSVNSSSVDVSSVDVNSLSDNKIQKIIQEMESKGISESQAIALAKARGMSDTQISQLKEKIQEYKLNGGSGTYSTSDDLLDSSNSSDDTELSLKLSIDSSKVDENIFGFDFFNRDNLTFEPSINIPVSNSYVLGAGDEILVDVWGASEQSYQLEVSSNGEVNIPLVGPVYLSGLTIEAAKSKLISALGNIYSDLRSDHPRTFTSIRTGKLKSIHVNVLGEVFNPGTYTVPGTASLFNVLYLCGGPDKNGSFRDIRLIRDGNVIAHLDVYDFLINGNTGVNISLADNDVVMVPTYRKRIAVGGEFKRTGLFEAIGDETVKDIIKYSGGFTDLAYKKFLRLYRTDGIQRSFKDVSLNNADSVTIESGDSLYVGKILDRYDNKVSIKGAVFNPGDYEYTNDLKLSDLINRADGLIENAYLNRGVITRKKPDFTLENISFDPEKVVNGVDEYSLKPNDEIYISSIDSMREERTVEIWGEVKNKGKYAYADNMRLEDLVFLAGGFNERASVSTVEVRRKLDYDRADKSALQNSELFHFKVSRDLKIENSNDFILKPFDIVSVRYMPGSQGSGSVTIKGNIMYGGIYNLITDRDRVSDVIKRAGGVSSNAYAEGASLIRKITLDDREIQKRKELKKIDTTLVFSDSEFESVGINLKRILEHPGSKEDIYMRDGDIVTVPSELQIVKVSGEILNSTSIIFDRKMNVKGYINASGGFSVNAKKKKTYVLNPNGSSYATKCFLFFRKYPKVSPGSEIMVPQKPEKTMTAASWISVASALASVGLSISTALYYLNR